MSGAVLAQQSPPIPQWQLAAGGKMAFEVASVKPSPPGAFRPPNFPLDPGPAFAAPRTGEPPRGRFSAHFPLIVYITFAYKLSLTPDQREAMVAHLPKWVASDAFEIEARAPQNNATRDNPTKDQMRLMMQSLLADRFNLAVHFETQTVPALAMVLAKPEKLGAQLRPHAEGPPCESAPSSDKSVFPPVCDVYSMMLQPNHMRRAGSRNTTMEALAGAIPTFGSVSRLVVDRTGLSGTFDFTLEWVPESNSAALPPGDAPPEPAGPTFPEALNEQLGLKLESTKAPTEVLIVDRVERPSAN
jgi:bla regulator protein BlaR1